jgi:hypothetical protein
MFVTDEEGFWKDTTGETSGETVGLSTAMGDSYIDDLVFGREMGVVDNRALDRFFGKTGFDSKPSPKDMSRVGNLIFSFSFSTGGSTGASSTSTADSPPWLRVRIPRVSGSAESEGVTVCFFSFSMPFIRSGGRRTR